MVKLLSPVHTAAGRSSLIAALVDSGDIFHPLAWSPQEAYRFLQDVPVLRGKRRAGAACPTGGSGVPGRGSRVTIGEKKRKLRSTRTRCWTSGSIWPWATRR